MEGSSDYSGVSADGQVTKMARKEWKRKCRGRKEPGADKSMERDAAREGQRQRCAVRVGSVW